jgi:hypothetical protein
MDALSRKLPPDLTWQSTYPYYRVIGQPWQADIDAALDEFMKLDMEQRKFWQRWAEKLNHALSNEFNTVIAIELRIKSPFAPQFEGLLRRYGAWLKDHLETTGVPADLQLAPAVGHVTAPANVFLKEGEYWAIAYEGSELVRIKHALGLSYIAALLRRPNEDRFVTDLPAELGHSLPTPAGRTLEAVSGEGLRQAWASDAGEMVDQQTLDQVRQQRADWVDDLTEAEADGDIERASQLQERIAKLDDYVKKATGLGGRSRRWNGPHETTRKAVSNAIRASLKNIEKAHPPLGAHLSVAIHTGRICSYRPDRPLVWDLQEIRP